MDLFHYRNEQNHTDKEAWPDATLMDRAIELGNMLREEYYTGERRAQLSREMGLIATEQFLRYQEKADR